MTLVKGRLRQTGRGLSRKFWSGWNYGPAGPILLEKWSARTRIPWKLGPLVELWSGCECVRKVFAENLSGGISVRDLESLHQSYGPA